MYFTYNVTYVAAIEEKVKKDQMTMPVDLVGTSTTYRKFIAREYRKTDGLGFPKK